jgi:hypothetical protein
MIIRTTRRTFVRGAASAVITLPFLRMLERPARAAAPKRLVVVVTPVATIRNNFWASGGQLGPILQPFADDPKVKPKVSMLRIDNMAGDRQPKVDHRNDFASILTGFHPLGDTSTIAAPSMEYYIGSKLNAPTTYPVLHVRTHARRDDVFASGRSRPISGRNVPADLFKDIFQGIGSGSMPAPTAMPDPTLERLRQNRQSMLSFLKDDLMAVRCQLGAEEKNKFDSHLEAIASLEKSLESTGAGAGTTAGCVKPATGPASTFNERTEFPALVQAQINNVVAALACDRTRVVGFMMGEAGSDGVHHRPWVPSLSGDWGHHDVAHGSALLGGGSITGAARETYLTEIDKWYAKQVYALVSKLNAIPDEGGKTLLDNTILFWIHEQAEGGNHQRLDHLTLLAGSGGGYLKTGQAFDLRGQPHQRLLMSFAEAMGVPFNPMLPYGDASLTPANGAERGDWARGPLAEIRA